MSEGRLKIGIQLFTIRFQGAWIGGEGGIKPGESQYLVTSKYEPITLSMTCFSNAVQEVGILDRYMYGKVEKSPTNTT